MDFLAFVVQKLWQNKQKLIKEIPWNYSTMSSMIWGLLALTWAPETPGSRSRPLQQWCSNFLARGAHLSFRNPSRATRINNLNKNYLKILLND